MRSLAERLAFPLPRRMQGLPRDHRGYVVPKFVAWIDGKPDFRVADPQHLQACVVKNLCWLCGHELGRFKLFAIGPMCVVNRTTAEPPCHHDCALYAVQVCPFLAVPQSHRRDHNLPGDTTDPAGVMLERNPGVTALYATLGYTRFRAGNGLLFRIGDPVGVTWWREGREATAEEVTKAISSGWPILYDLAQQEGQEAIAALRQYALRAERLVPGHRYTPPIDTWATEAA